MSETLIPKVFELKTEKDYLDYIKHRDEDRLRKELGLPEKYLIISLVMNFDEDLWWVKELRKK